MAKQQVSMEKKDTLYKRLLMLKLGVAFKLVKFTGHSV